VYSRLDVHFASKATELLRGSDDVMGHAWTYMRRKFLFRDNDDRNERTNGEITDPILLMPITHIRLRSIAIDGSL
jgi:hypothetical protein